MEGRCGVCDAVADPMCRPSRMYDSHPAPLDGFENGQWTPGIPWHCSGQSGDFHVLE